MYNDTCALCKAMMLTVCEIGGTAVDVFFLWGCFFGLVWFGLVSLFNGISTTVGYLMPKPFYERNSSGNI